MTDDEVTGGRSCRSLKIYRSLCRDVVEATRDEIVLNHEIVGSSTLYLFRALCDHLSLCVCHESIMRVYDAQRYERCKDQRPRSIRDLESSERLSRDFVSL